MGEAKMIEAMKGTVLTVFDGHKTIAKAMRVGAGDWLLRMYDGCWMHPDARKPSRVTRSVDARLMVLTTRREAKREMLLLLEQVKKGVRHVK